MTCKYFSGFCLQNEYELFKEYIIDTKYSVCGFSYGAIKAFEYTLNTDTRIDSLQLFSPAFFEIKDKKFKRTQLMFFKKDSKSYCENFLKNVIFPTNIDISKYFNLGKVEELDELLNYKWDTNKLQDLIDRGIKIEVYLGENDKIIDSHEACKFFKEFATVYFIKEKGHIL